MSPFQKVLFKSAVLTKSFLLFFGFTFFLLCNKFSQTYPSFFFKESPIGVNSVEECFLLLYCFSIAGNTSTQSPSPLNKTGRLRRILIVRLKRSAKTPPKEVFLEYLYYCVYLGNQ